MSQQESNGAKGKGKDCIQESNRAGAMEGSRKSDREEAGKTRLLTGRRFLGRRGWGLVGKFGGLGYRWSQKPLFVGVALRLGEWE